MDTSKSDNSVKGKEANAPPIAPTDVKEVERKKTEGGRVFNKSKGGSTLFSADAGFSGVE